MSAPWDPEEAKRLAAELREDDARTASWPATHADHMADSAGRLRLRDNAKPLADQLEAALAEIKRLEDRVQDCVTVLDGTLEDDSNLSRERRRLLAEIRQLQQTSARAEKERDEALAEVERLRAAVNRLANASLLEKAAAVPPNQSFARVVAERDELRAEVDRLTANLEAERPATGRG